MANENPERVDPVYAYIDGRINELDKELLLTQRSIATLYITSVSAVILSNLRRSDPQKYEALNRPIRSQIVSAFIEMDKSDKPLNIASEFADNMAEWLSR
jgi:hypothetical protein